MICLWKSDLLLRKKIVEQKIIKNIGKEHEKYDEKNDIVFWEIRYKQDIFVIYRYITSNNRIRYYLNDTFDNYEKMKTFKYNVEKMDIVLRNNCLYFTDKERDINLSSLFEMLSKVDYSENTFNNKRHEDTVEEILQSFGLKQIENTKQRSEYGYIKQPNGTQNQPDFRLLLNDNEIDIECKSCKNGYKPMWNANYPSKRTVYLYTNKKDNNTLLFLGETIVTPEIEDIYNEYKKEIKNIEREINQKLLNLGNKNPFGMTVYARNMFVQTKHLNHTIKETLKKKVIEEHEFK